MSVYRGAPEASDEGFTLIELMVVVLIIGILMAIAVPTFLGAQNSANGRLAQASVRDAFAAEQAVFTTAQTYQASVGTMNQTEPGVTWNQFGNGTGWTATGRDVYLEANSSVAQSAEMVVGALGKDNNCYWVLSVGGQVYYGKAAVSGSTGCALSGSWTTSWGGANASPQPTLSGLASAA